MLHSLIYSFVHYLPTEGLNLKQHTWANLLQRTSSHPLSGGHSGTNTQSASDAKAATSARYLTIQKRSSATADGPCDALTDHAYAW